MVIDTSALIAVLLDEPEQHRFDVCIQAASERFISAATLLETSIVIESRKGEAGGKELDRLLSRQHSGDSCNCPTGPNRQTSISAVWEGRTSCEIEFWDCLTYALAKVMGEPLLCKGDDFPKTDILLVNNGRG